MSLDRVAIMGGKRLSGEVDASGAKNSALPVLISSILTSDECRYTRVPHLEDIKTTFKLLSGLGADVKGDLSLNKVSIQAKDMNLFEAPYDLVRKMRASVVVLGPLLARLGKAKVSLPGGCAIGTRPIDLHLFGLEKLGAKITLEQGYVIAEAKKLTGAKVPFAFPSVGATENVLMAATLAKGTTLISNAAREPEIVDLADALRKMGAKIQGDGTENIEVQGVDSLHGCDFEILPDRIEVGTFLIAAAMTQGDVTVKKCNRTHIEALITKLEEVGAKVESKGDSVRLHMNSRPQACDVTTEPFPGFPTDIQAQWMALMTIANGTSKISETIFENRFMHVPELLRLGADIQIRGNQAIVVGKEKLLGAPLMATDLRASASLILAGLVAEGKTIVNRVYHLDRGYERLEEKLRKLGAVIERLKGEV